MNPSDYILRDEPIEPFRVHDLLACHDEAVELLPMLRYRFGDALHPALYSVALTRDSTLVLLRSDGLPEGFLDYLKQCPEPGDGIALRVLEVDLSSLLPEGAARELKKRAREVLCDDAPDAGFHLTNSLLPLLFDHLDSMAVAGTAELFRNDQLSRLCQHGDARRDLAETKVRFDAVWSTASSVFQRLQQSAAKLGPEIRGRMAEQVEQRLRDKPAYGVHGDEHDSAWDEFCYALAHDALLKETVEREIVETIYEVLDELSEEDRSVLWLATGEANGWFDARLDNGDVFDPYDMSPADRDYREVVEMVRGRLCLEVEPT